MAFLSAGSKRKGAYKEAKRKVRELLKFPFVLEEEQTFRAPSTHLSPLQDAGHHGHLPLQVRVHVQDAEHLLRGLAGGDDGLRKSR